MTTDRNATGFEGKIAVVTGAASGIGRATTTLLAGSGAAVLLVDKDADRLSEAGDALRATGASVAEYAVDLTDDGAPASVAAAAMSKFGEVQLLVNNAAAFVQRGVDATAGEWRAALATNLIAPAQLIAAFRPQMRARGGGSIVNLGSTSGVSADADFATYNSSKAALIMMSQCFAIDLGPDNIRVNCVAPGITLTEKMHDIIKTEFDNDFSAFSSEFLPKQCLSRFCQPEDAARAIGFLLSDEAQSITGTTLIVDAGLTVKR